jgi:Leucine-rich repeat (LRR) protein
MSYGPHTDILMRLIQDAYDTLDDSLDVAGLGIHSLPLLPDNLKELICYSTCLTSLPPLPNGLQKLSCSNTKLTSLPPLPNGLTILECQNTPITSLPPLPNSLKELVCYNTLLTSLPPLPYGLEALWCFNTKLPERDDFESMNEYIYRIRSWQKQNRIQERTRMLKKKN